MSTFLRSLGLLIAGLGLAGSLWGQSLDTLPMSTPIQAAIAAQTRTLNGQPGPAYWINRARYRLQATVLPETRALSAQGDITYVNRSPDTLRQLVMHLYQNLYRADATRDDDIKASEQTEGIQISRLLLGGDTLVPAVDNPRARIERTLLYVALPEGLMPGDSVTLHADWAFTIPGASTIRMGTYGEHAYFVGYWYPQVAVYDDVFGWDTVQHTGLQEFYQDFADFDLRVTVPDSLLVWATGTLDNIDSVLTPTYAARLRQAQQSDRVIRIVGAQDYAGDSVIARPYGMNTWHFRASNLPDVAFALSDYYYWDASSVAIDSPARRVLTDACYQPQSEDFAEVAGFARDIIGFLSDSLPGVPYPYPAMTVFNGDTRGYGGGMEFPMIVNDGSSYSLSSAFDLTHHELAHTYFPFMMGINEHRYAFMDEGWASLLPSDLMAQRGYSSAPMAWNVMSYAGFAGNPEEEPLMTDANLLDGNAYYANAYYKPATAYHVLRGVMGDSLFKAALRTYLQRWSGKHPLPYDFFYTFDAVAGESLAWFWRPWFFETLGPDLALDIKRVKRKKVSLDVRNEGGLPLPIYLRITLDDGQKIRYQFPASVWKNGEQTFSFKEKMAAPVIEVDLGRGDVPDVDPDNNSYDIKP